LKATILVFEQNEVFNEKDEPYFLSEGKKIRYDMSTFEDTKRSIIFSSILSYYSVRVFGVELEQSCEVFAKSDYEVNTPKLTHSNAHCNDMYVEVIQPGDEKIGIDIEEMRSRDPRIYHRMGTNSKKEFYIRWGQRECVIKSKSESDHFQTFTINNYLVTVLGVDADFDVIRVNREDIFNQVKKDIKILGNKS
jgi:hypothetical protein